MAPNDPNDFVNTSKQPPDRFHGLDALRAVTMLSVVVLHSSIAYMTVGMPDLLWPLHDRSASRFFDWFFLWLQGFAMPVFFLISGFWSRDTYERSGARAFAAKRARRLLAPFLLACVAFLPVIYYVWSSGWLLTGRIDLRSLLLAKFSDRFIRHNIDGPAHLWFLEYLIILTAGFWLYRQLRNRFSKKGGPDYSTKLPADFFVSFGAPLVLAVPTAVLFFTDLGALINFRNSFVPGPARFLHYALFFAAGAMLHAHRRRLPALKRWAPFHFVMSLILFSVTGALLWPSLRGGIIVQKSACLAAAAALFCWTTVYAMIGLSLKWLDFESRPVRYLAESSYWIFLSHLPVVGLAQVLLFKTSLPVSLKFSITLLAAVSAGLVSYRYWVRYTRIGALIDGPRYPRGRKEKTPAKMKWAVTAVLLISVAGAGMGYHRLYTAERSRYEGIIAGYFERYFGRPPTPEELRYWTAPTMNRWGLEKTERLGFIRAKAEGKSGPDRIPKEFV